MKKLVVLLSVGGLFFLIGCYSFRGSSISPDLKTIQIQNFSMNTSGGPANMALSMSEKMKEYFQRNSGLKLANVNPDLQMEGSITGFDVSPVAPTVSSGNSFGGTQSSTDRGGLNRLTITIQVRFSNNKDETKNFDQSFSFYADFPQNQTVTQVEGTLVPKILDQIVLDIFNKAAGDW
ncbi:MAG: LptE family protein [Spirosomataceae bacterium]